MEEGNSNHFQPVLFAQIGGSIGHGWSQIVKHLDLNRKSTCHNLECYDLQLTNKYYETTIHLCNLGEIGSDEHDNILSFEYHAVIIYIHAGEEEISQATSFKFMKFNKNLDDGDFPKILVCDGVFEGESAYSTLWDMSLKYGYDFLRSYDTEFRQDFIDSLSAYKWPHRVDKDFRPLSNLKTLESKEGTDCMPTSSISHNHSKKEKVEHKESAEDVRKLEEFDNLLNKLSDYRSKPELRVNRDMDELYRMAESLDRFFDDDSTSEHDPDEKFH